jgi:hypothetical protein
MKKTHALTVTAFHRRMQRKAGPLMTKLEHAFHFFFYHAGYIVGQRASCALSLARAEQYAEDNDWKAEWVNDDDADLSWMSEEEQQQPHEVLGCVLKDADGNVLASLWGIVDADSNYRRVIEAEVAASNKEIPW